MGVLEVFPVDTKDKDSLKIVYLKETIQIYLNGRNFHLVRLFLEVNSSHFSGLSILMERRILQASDKSKLLVNPQLMQLLKEKHFLLMDDDTEKLDDYHYKIIDFDISFENIGNIGKLDLSTIYKPDNKDSKTLLAFQILLEMEKKKDISKLKLYLFGSLNITTYILYTPSTIDISDKRFPMQPKFISYEQKAIIVDRYELWLAIQGYIEATKVTVDVPIKRSQYFNNISCLESFYGLPVMKRYWEICVNYNKQSEFYNEKLSCSIHHQRTSLIIGWFFGIIGILGFILAIYTLLY